MSKFQGYNYSWKGYFKYQKEKGNWVFHNKGEWSISQSGKPGVSLKKSGLKTFAEKIENKRKSLIDKLINTKIIVLHSEDKDKKVLAVNALKQRCDLSNSEGKNKDILDWLKSDDGDLPVKGALAICLQNFVEVKSLAPESNKLLKYTIESSIVGNNMMVNINSTPEGCNPFSKWFFINSKDYDIVFQELPEYLLTLPELFFDGESNIKQDLIETATFLKSHRIIQNVSIKCDPKKSGEIKFKSKCKIIHYHKGFICGCISIPGKQNKKKGNEPNIVKTPEMVVTSPNVVEALEYLSQVWQDKFATSVLISAPPGSGKENFSNSIAYGTGRLSPNEDVSEYTISLASGDKTELEKKLYGEIKHKGKKELIVNSLINEAKGKVIFLDEVHHPEEEPGIRASLLRPLESGEYEPNGAKVPSKIKDVLFILATSKPFKVKKKGEKCLNDIPPPDFWTRMTHVVTIKHPFESIWDKNFSDIIEHYFLFFWWDRLEKYFQVNPETNKPIEEGAVIDDKYKQRLAQMEKLKDDDNDNKNLKKLATLFRERLVLILREERIQPYQLSIRGFRNIVTRLFSISAAKISQGYDFKPKELEKQIDPVIYEILGIATLDT